METQINKTLEIRETFHPHVTSPSVLVSGRNHTKWEESMTQTKHKIQAVQKIEDENEPTASNTTA